MERKERIKKNKSTISDYKTSKEYAVEYFPRLFKKDFTLKDEITIADLNKEYNKCLELAKIDLDEYKIEKIELEAAYQAVVKMINERIEPKSEIVEELLKEYYKLTSVIANYRFKSYPYTEYEKEEHKTNKNGPHAYNQNIANKKILFDISLFTPMLHMILENIDDILTREFPNNNNDSFITALIDELKHIKEELNNTRYLLADAENSYHDTWDSVMGRSYGRNSNYNELGRAKETWRKQKNDALHTISEFYQRLWNINKYLGFIGVIHDIDIIETNYLENRKNIETGPYAYSYLDSSSRSALCKRRKPHTV